MQYLFRVKCIHKLWLKEQSSPSTPNCFSQELCLLSMTHWTFHFSMQWNKFSRWSRAYPALGYTPFGRWAMVVWILSRKEINESCSPLLGGCCRAFNIFHSAAFWRKAAASTRLHVDPNLGAQSDLACPQSRQGSVWGDLDKWGQGLSCALPSQWAQKWSCCCKWEVMPETPLPSWWNTKMLRASAGNS